MVTYGPPDSANEAILGRVLLTSVVLRDLSRATLDDAQDESAPSRQRLNACIWSANVQLHTIPSQDTFLRLFLSTIPKWFCVERSSWSVMFVVIVNVIE